MIIVSDHDSPEVGNPTGGALDYISSPVVIPKAIVLSIHVPMILAVRCQKTYTHKQHKVAYVYNVRTILPLLPPSVTFSCLFQWQQRSAATRFRGSIRELAILQQNSETGRSL